MAALLPSQLPSCRHSSRFSDTLQVSLLSQPWKRCTDKELLPWMAFQCAAFQCEQTVQLNLHSRANSWQTRVPKAPTPSELWVSSTFSILYYRKYMQKCCCAEVMPLWGPNSPIFTQVKPWINLSVHAGFGDVTFVKTHKNTNSPGHRPLFCPQVIRVLSALSGKSIQARDWCTALILLWTSDASFF